MGQLSTVNYQPSIFKTTIYIYRSIYIHIDIYIDISRNINIYRNRAKTPHKPHSDPTRHETQKDIYTQR